MSISLISSMAKGKEGWQECNRVLSDLEAAF